MLRQLTLMAALTLFALPAFSAKKADPKETIANLDAMVTEFQGNANVNELIPELKRLTDSLAEAKVFIKDEDKEKPLERSLKFAQVQARLLKARFEEIAAKQSFEAVNQACNEAEAAAKELDSKVKELEAGGTK